MLEAYWTEYVAVIYRELEEELVAMVIKRLKVGTNNKKDLTQWQFEKLQDLGLISIKTIQKIVKATGQTEEAIEEAFRVGPETVLRLVDNTAQHPIKKPNSNIDLIIEGYKKQAREKLLNLTGENLGLPTYGPGDMIQKYRRILERTATFVNTGMFTLEHAVERASHEILTEGLKTTLTSKSGRQIALDSYVRTVMKTNLARTYDEVRKEHMEDYGMHHVVVGSLVGAREACSKIQGQVVDLRPMDEIPEGSEYRSIYDPYWEAHYQEASGHHGINCRHPHFPFIPGVNTNNQPQYDEELNRQVSEDQQKQRSLERQIREYKKHLKIAQGFGNQKDIDRYTKLISGRQKALRELLDGHEYLSRDYARERAFDFSSSPPKDIVAPEIIEVEPEVVEYFESGSLTESIWFFNEQPGHNQWRREVSPEQAQAIKDYSDDMYKPMNALLRDDHNYIEMFKEGRGLSYLDEVWESLEHLRDALSEYTTEDNFKLRRNVYPYGMPKDIWNKIYNSKPGEKIVPDAGLASASMTSEERGFGPVTYDIEVPKGVNIGAYVAEFAEYQEEDEFLLAPGVEFEVIENNLNKPGQTIKLRAVGVHKDHIWYN